MTFKRILCAVDGSENATAALTLSAHLAHQYDARLIVLHTLARGPVPKQLAKNAGIDVESPRYSKGRDAIGLRVRGPYPMPEHQQRQLGEYILNKAVELAKHEGAHDPALRLEQGEAHERIVQVAKEDGVDLVVVGRTGTGRWHPPRLGKVSRSVMEDLAGCSCLIVDHPDQKA
jgi:nucleotide-binding universal stress UspA family protein